VFTIQKKTFPALKEISWSIKFTILGKQQSWERYRAPAIVVFPRM
jgi:hypothetical protein